jgi:hypothetical protein
MLSACTSNFGEVFVGNITSKTTSVVFKRERITTLCTKSNGTFIIKLLRIDIDLKWNTCINFVVYIYIYPCIVRKMFLICQSITFSLISAISAIFIGLYFYFTRNFKFWQKFGITYVKRTPFVGNLKECLLLDRTIEQLQIIYNEHSDKPYVGIFSFDKPVLLIRDL